MPKIVAKVNHTGNTVPFGTVKKILSQWYAKDAKVKVTFLASGIIVEMDLSMFYSTVEELNKVNDAFGMLNDDRFMVLDAELLEFTAVHNSVVKAELWKQPRYTVNQPSADDTHEERGSLPTKRS